MKFARFFAIASLAGNDGIERSKTGAPSAFRIWTAGENPTDHGTHYLTPDSARALLAEQAKRANLYSIDVDHLSLNDNAPPESHKAVGWFRIETRDSKAGPELWAVDVQWTDAVKAGLEKDVPEWRYHSPAYVASKKSGEIVSLLNIALTNNPATWGVTQLATRGESTMNLKAILAALMGDDEEKKTEAMAALKAAMAGDDKEAATKATAIHAAFGEPDAKKDEPAADPPAEKKEAVKAAEDAPPPAKEEEPSKDTIAATAKLVATIGEQGRELAKLTKIQDEQERARIMATRPDLVKAQRDALADEPTSKLVKLLALIPAPIVDPAAAARVNATVGAGRGGQGGSEGFGLQRASRLPPKEREEIRARMGGDQASKGIHWDPDHPNDLCFSSMTRDEAKAHLATMAKRSAPNADAKGGSR